MVLEAADSQASGVEDALSDLCQQYWYPLYAFVRRKGYSRSEAEDLTQGFFTDFLEKNRLQLAKPARGSFRAFLLTSLSNFITNHWRAETAQKRGGGQTVLSIDFEQADDRYAGQPADDLTPEKIFERNWAMSILEQTLEAVAQQYAQSGKHDVFDGLKGYLTGNVDLPYSALADSLGMREGAVKVAVHRLRQRYGHQLRLQIAKTVQNPADVDQELRSLFKSLD